MNDFNCPDQKKYLGDKVVNKEDTEFKNYSPSDWAMYFISSYGQIDGSHHKTWCLDTVAKILKGTPVIIKQASWSDGYKEYRISLAEDSDDYTAWAKSMLGDYDKESDSYDSTYDKGIAP